MSTITNLAAEIHGLKDQLADPTLSEIERVALRNLTTALQNKENIMLQSKQLGM
jgi:hypothetical protein